jgi:S-layer homology domain
VRLASLLQNNDRRRDAVLITDIRGNWASNWIMSVARAGVMEPFANHAFQPRAVVRRTDLATAVSRLLGRVATVHPEQSKTWEGARIRFTDLSPSHLAYPAASAAVAAGVLKTAPDNAFQPTRLVAGAEAIEAIAKLEAMAGLPPAAKPKTPQ